MRHHFQSGFTQCLQMKGKGVRFWSTGTLLLNPCNMGSNELWATSMSRGETGRGCACAMAIGTFPIVSSKGKVTGAIPCRHQARTRRLQQSQEPHCHRCLAQNLLFQKNHWRTTSLIGLELKLWMNTHSKALTKSQLHPTFDVPLFLLGGLTSSGFWIGWNPPPQREAETSQQRGRVHQTTQCHSWKWLQFKTKRLRLTIKNN